MAKNAKNTKKATTTQGKPITDFFALASKPQPSKMRVSSSRPSQASSSEDSEPTGTSKTTSALNNSKVASIVSKQPIESSSGLHSRELLDGSESHSTKTRSSKTPFVSSSAISSSRSPDFQAHVGSSAPLNNKKALSDTVKVSHRRRNKCDSDSDIEMLNTAVNSTVCHSSIPQWGTYSDIFSA